MTEAVINPVWAKGLPIPGPVAVLAATRGDVDRLRRRLHLTAARGHDLLMSRIFVDSRALSGVSLAGPMIGAPYAAMVLETLIAGGAHKFIFFGWCGAISPAVKIGDIVIPSAALSDEGTSRHYRSDGGLIAAPPGDLQAQVKRALNEKGLGFHEGVVWTTDAVYRETRESVERCQGQGVLAVEMETAALFSIGRFRHVDIGTVLVVSDELSALSWRPGFHTTRFRNSLEAAAEVISGLSRRLGQTTD